jgi:hypothetical protein
MQHALGHAEGDVLVTGTCAQILEGQNCHGAAGNPVAAGGVSAAGGWTTFWSIKRLKALCLAIRA